MNCCWHTKTGASPGGDLNPLHGGDGVCEAGGAPELIDALSRVAADVAGVVELGFYAIDAIRSPSGFQVIEINPNPMCYFYNLHNGRSDFVGIYEKLIQRPSAGFAAAGRVSTRNAGREQIDEGGVPVSRRQAGITRSTLNSVRTDTVSLAN